MPGTGAAQRRCLLPDDDGSVLQASSGDDRDAGGLAADRYGDPTVISIGLIEGADLQHERRLRSLGLPECGEGVVRCCVVAMVVLPSRPAG